MSLRCSLLGHEYGESEIERDREERGNEVVISVVELERCTRCEKTRTISENTEVTQLSQPRSPSEADSAVSESTDFETRSNADSRPTGPGIEPRPEAEMGFEADPDDEDTEIIEDDEGSDRNSGDWPDVEDHDRGAGETSNAWPETDGEDEGFDATIPDGKTDVEFGGGLTPQADQGAEIIESGPNDSSDDDGPTFRTAGSTPTPDRPTGTGGETTLYCRNCETSGLEERESLRAGDICPECHRGYLAEGER